MAELLVLSIALILVAVIVLRYQRQAAHKHVDSQSKSYRAVGIRISTGACSAVRDFSGRRFLGRDAPKLPVAGCSATPCLCRYTHFADRRAEDRRVQYGVMSRLQSKAGFERRRHDRRQAVA